MQSLVRDTAQLSAKKFDILVIGGGINGVACAWEAALRGLSVALIDKSDFGSAASAGCFKLVHGGLRYLQHLNIARLRESVQEQRTLRQIASHLVHPMPFLVPAYGWGMRGKEVLGLGMRLYELLAHDRNHGFSESHLLPDHKALSKAECLRIAPGLCPEGLRGGLVYHDAQMSNCDRLTFAVVQSAAEVGAVVCNYVEATEFRLSSADATPRIVGVAAKDCVDDRTLEITADLVINAAGPWAPVVEKLLPGEHTKTPLQYSKGVQLVMKQFVDTYAVAIESKHRDAAARVSRGGRSFFVHPWRGSSLLGTADILHSGSPDSFEITKEEIAGLVEEAREMYQDDSLQVQNVTHAFGGLRPLAKSQVERMKAGYVAEAHEANVSMKEEILDHELDLGPEHPRVANLVSLVGVKYTTFRAFAEQAVNVCARKLRVSVAKSVSNNTRLYGCPEEDFGQLRLHHADEIARWGAELVEHLLRNYGTQSRQLFDLMDREPALSAPLVAQGDTIAAEVIYVGRHEMVCSLVDVAFRRTGLGTLGNPGDFALTKAAELLAREKGWSLAEQAEQVREVQQAFPKIS